MTKKKAFQIKKLNREEMEKFFDSMDFFDFDDFETKEFFQWKIEFCQNVNTVIYSDLQGINIKKRFRKKQFQKKQFLLQQCMKELLACIEEEHCYLKRYNEKWIVRKLKSIALYKQLKHNRIFNEASTIIMTEKNSPLIFRFFDSIMKYNSFVLFAFPDSKVIIAPTDHMDIFIYSKHREMEQYIIKCISQINSKKEVLQMQRLHHI